MSLRRPKLSNSKGSSVPEEEEEEEEEEQEEEVEVEEDKKKKKYVYSCHAIQNLLCKA
jgi:hypothetical protein